MGAVMNVEHEPEYDWPRPPVGGYTADDLDRLPNLPPHTELIDGSLVMMSPQTAFHSRAMRLLENELLRLAPEGLEIFREMTVTLGKRDRPEPDVMAVKATAYTGPEQTSFLPEDVVLAIEVVSADSLKRDREVKPRKYAAAGIPHFWRVERDKKSGRTAVYVYEVDPATRAYLLTGIHHDQLKLGVPFAIDIDLSRLA
ncbi:Uma2 family endonuclease [Streptomyces xiamenensis]|uniref:Uma2 family endonuclease n=1 Tax=Streptomyces sp. NRRL F-2890 TaxID=1463845 RepID=UPI0004CBDF94|nr:Uma2 family endonuclease [Streptomyces sp. NRRL F-2890]